METNLRVFRWVSYDIIIYLCLYVCMHICMYVSMYVCIFSTKKFTIYYNTYENRHNTINIKAKNVKENTPITVAGIALKGQAGLISIMIPLEVLVQTTRNEEDRKLNVF